MKPTPMRSRTGHGLVIGVDMGGTQQSAALADARGELLARARRVTDRDGGATTGFAGITSLIGDLVAAAKHRRKPIAGIGIGFGGPVDEKTGTVMLSHHVNGWENLPLKSRIEKAFGLPAFVDNDANAAALGEWRFGAGRGARDMVYVNIGTGIGGGVIANGSLVRGRHNAAGEIGHMVIDPQGPRCACGKHGCLESLCSGPAIAWRAQDRARGKGVATVLGGDCSAREVFAAARQGDSVAREIVSETAVHLAHGIGNALNLLNPELVILGGGVAGAEEVLLAPVRERVMNYCLPLHRRGLKIVAAKLGRDAGVRGAVALAIEGIRVGGRKMEAP